MARLIGLLTLSFVAIALAFNVQADDKKETKLTGTVTCAKCGLKKSKKCETVIVVKNGKKETVYYFDAAGHKKFHGDTCTEAKEGTVTGTVAKEGKKMVITVEKVEYK